MTIKLRSANNLRNAKLLLVIGGTVLGGSVANADVIYQQDFENWNNADRLWSTDTQANLGGPYTNVLGRFSAETARLTILANELNTPWLNGGGGSNGGNGGDNGGGTSGGPNGGGGTGGGTSGGGNNGPAIIPHIGSVTPHILNDGTTPQGNGGAQNPLRPNQSLITNGTKQGTDSLVRIDAPNPGDDGPRMFTPGSYAVTFDLMLFDSWDGGTEPWGPDYFSVAVNGETQFHEMMGYSDDWNFRAPDEIPGLNAYDDRWFDIIHRGVEIVFEITEATDTLTIDFIGLPNQSIDDESWGLDNVLVERLSTPGSTPAVPAPSSLLLLGSGFGLVTRRKR